MSSYDSGGTGAYFVQRFVTGIVVAAGAVASTVIFLLAIGAMSADEIARFNVVEKALQFDWSRFNWLERIWVAGSAVVIGLIFIVLLLRLLTPRGRKASWHLLDADENGFVVVDSQGVSTIATQAALTASGVVDVETSILGTGYSPIRVKVGIGVYPGADVLKVGKEVRAAVKEAVQRYAGMSVTDVAVKAHIIEPDYFGRALE